MTNEFTLIKLKKLKARDKPYEVRSPDTKGLMLRVQPSGRKSFYYEHSRGKRSKVGKDGNWMLENLTISQIKKKALEVAAEGPNETKLDRQKTTLGGFVDNDYKDYIADKIITHKEVLSIIKNNFSHLYSKHMTDIQPMDIDRWKRKRKDEVSFKTLQTALAHLKACLNCARIDFRYIPTHNLIGYSLKRSNSAEIPKKRIIRYLSLEEEMALRNALTMRERDFRKARLSGNVHRLERGIKPLRMVREHEYFDHIQPIVLLALNTGLRRGDLFSLQWSHINFELKHISKVMNKTRRKIAFEWVIPLSTEALLVLQQWRKQANSSALVFPSPVTGGQLDNIQSAWEELKAKAKIKAFRFHDLRHTFASKLVMAGVPLNTVRELMCHSDIRMTLVYAHLSEDHKADAIREVFDKN